MTENGPNQAIEVSSERAHVRLHIDVSFISIFVVVIKISEKEGKSSCATASYFL